MPKIVAQEDFWTILQSEPIIQDVKPWQLTYAIFAERITSTAIKMNRRPLWYFIIYCKGEALRMLLYNSF